MTTFLRLLLAAVIAYVVIGSVYSTWWMVHLELGRRPGGVPAALWPAGLVGFHKVPELLVAYVYLATIGLVYLAARRRSAPRHLKSTYSNDH